MSNGSWLTKSLFLAGEQCPKRLWQQCHAPLEEGTGSSPVTDTGLEVGRFAHRLFPDGAVAWTEGQTASQAIAATRATDVAGSWDASCFREDGLSEVNNNIPRSRHNPKILWIDDAEIVGDRIT